MEEPTERSLSCGWQLTSCGQGGMLVLIPDHRWVLTILPSPNAENHYQCRQGFINRKRRSRSEQSVIELEKFYHTESQRQRGGRIYKPPCNSSDTLKDNKSDCVVDAATPNCSNRLPLSSLPYTPSVAFPTNYSFSYTAGGFYQALGSGKGRTFSFIKNSPPIDPPNVGSDGS
ncbi:hypothetical protein BDP27DRAFT_1374140 [Rhodocollybia butyracea]|uniref:Uncharacterized protein n=1 Tax=Rhodocollybia butyracea TaxID=206335 RepID=A0A9P5TVM7_9AGAR|nr:hypothetical protein BDP27DRAFT_1374140 [Rhodocollybia butyracea]